MWRNSPPFWANRYGWFGRTCKSLRKVFLKRFYSRKTIQFIRAINSASDSCIFSAKSSGDCGFKGISKPKVCIVPPKPLSSKVLFSSAPFSFSFRGKIKPPPGDFHHVHIGDKLEQVFPGNFSACYFFVLCIQNPFVRLVKIRIDTAVIFIKITNYTRI